MHSFDADILSQNTFDNAKNCCLQEFAKELSREFCQLPPETSSTQFYNPRKLHHLCRCKSRDILTSSGCLPDSVFLSSWGITNNTYNEREHSVWIFLMISKQKSNDFFHAFFWRRYTLAKSFRQCKKLLLAGAR